MVCCRSFWVLAPLAVLAMWTVASLADEEEDEGYDGEAAVRTGRAVNLDKSDPHPRLRTADDSAEDTAYQSCRTPYGEQGHCRHVRFCVLDEFRHNFDRFRDYACVIEGSVPACGSRFIGVCCPDNRDILDKSRDSNGVWRYRNSSSQYHRQSGSQYGQPNRQYGRQRGRQYGRQRGRQSGGKPFRTRRPNFLPDLRDPQSSMSAANRDRLRSRSCGEASTMVGLTGGRVEGGQQTEPGQYPWMAALLRTGQQQFCGGVLLDSRHVLTAAHCVYNLQPEELLIGLGEYDLSRPDPNQVQSFEVSALRVHEDFNAEAYTDDIALITLRGEVQFSDWVWPICLPPADLDFSGANAVVIGWGTVYYGGPPSDVLMAVTIPVWSPSQCQARYDQPILDTEICAGTTQGGKDSCQGDSGGPLLLTASDGRWCTIGIVSFGVRCGEPNKPGVYTRVDKYLDWIARNARN